ncbi:uncharacterized protein LOC126326591 [Schistocerca gregaria]|uniref:uncharacterized protein LOC126326591 n=1 Tax=Schistocerca gregaria TaxID=7010 RepID=UPI00211F238F|nr:uncharacterized protein LOC126326591 [Schistocerca gregaria]
MNTYNLLFIAVLLVQFGTYKALENAANAEEINGKESGSSPAIYFHNHPCVTSSFKKNREYISLDNSNYMVLSYESIGNATFSIEDDWHISEYDMPSINAIQIYLGNREHRDTHFLMKNQSNQYFWYNQKNFFFSKLSEADTDTIHDAQCLRLAPNSALLLRHSSPIALNVRNCDANIIRSFRIYPNTFPLNPIRVHPQGYRVFLERIPPSLTKDNNFLVSPPGGLNSNIRLHGETPISADILVCVNLEQLSVGLDTIKNSFSGLFEQLKNLGFETSSSSPKDETRVYLTMSWPYKDLSMYHQMPIAYATEQKSINQIFEDSSESKTIPVSIPRANTTADHLLKLLKLKSIFSRSDSLQLLVYVSTVCPTYTEESIKDILRYDTLVLFAYPKYPVPPHILSCVENMQRKFPIQLMHPNHSTDDWLFNPFEFMTPQNIKDFCINFPIFLSDDCSLIFKYRKKISENVLTINYDIIMKRNRLSDICKVHFLGYGNTVLQAFLRPFSQFYNSSYEIYVNNSLTFSMPLSCPSDCSMAITPINRSDKLGTFYDENNLNIPFESPFLVSTLSFVSSRDSIGSAKFKVSVIDKCSDESNGILTINLLPISQSLQNVEIPLNALADRVALIELYDPETFPLIETMCKGGKDSCFKIEVRQIFFTDKIGTLTTERVPQQNISDHTVVSGSKILFHLNKKVTQARATFSYSIILGKNYVYNGNVTVMAFPGDVAPEIRHYANNLYSSTQRNRTITLNLCDRNALYRDESLNLLIDGKHLGTQVLAHYDPLTKKQKIISHKNITEIGVIIKNRNECTPLFLEWNSSNEETSNFTIKLVDQSGRESEPTTINLVKDGNYTIKLEPRQDDEIYIEDANPVELKYHLAANTVDIVNYRLRFFEIPEESKLTFINHPSLSLDTAKNNTVNYLAFGYPENSFNMLMINIKYSPPAEVPADLGNLTLKFAVEFINNSTEVLLYSANASVTFYYKKPEPPISNNYTISAVCNVPTEFEIHAVDPYLGAAPSLKFLDDKEITGLLEEQIRDNLDFEDPESFASWDNETKAFYLVYTPRCSREGPLNETVHFMVCTKNSLRANYCSETYYLSFDCSYPQLDLVSSDKIFSSAFKEVTEITFDLIDHEWPIDISQLNVRLINLDMLRFGALYYDKQLKYKIKEGELLLDITQPIYYYSNMSVLDSLYHFDPRQTTEMFNYVLESNYKRSKLYFCFVKLEQEHITPVYIGDLNLTCSSDLYSQHMLSQHMAGHILRTYNFSIKNFSNVEIVGCDDLYSCNDALNQSQLPYFFKGVSGRFLFKINSSDSKFGNIHISISSQQTTSDYVFTVSAVEPDFFTPTIYSDQVQISRATNIVIDYGKDEFLMEWIVSDNIFHPAFIMSRLHVYPYVSRSWELREQKLSEDDQQGMTIVKMNPDSYLDKRVIDTHSHHSSYNCIKRDSGNLKDGTQENCVFVFRLIFMLPNLDSYGVPYLSISVRSYNGLYYSTRNLRYVFSVPPPTYLFDLYIPPTIEVNQGLEGTYIFNSDQNYLPDTTDNVLIGGVRTFDTTLFTYLDSQQGVLIFPEDAECNQISNTYSGSVHIWKCTGSLSNINKWILNTKYKSNQSSSHGVVTFKACQQSFDIQIYSGHCQVSTTRIVIKLKNDLTLIYIAAGISVLVFLLVIILLIQRGVFKGKPKSNEVFTESVKPNPLYKSPNQVYTSSLYIPPRLSSNISI